MTVREVERLAKVEAKQDSMANDLNEIKTDIKELKVMMMDVKQNYVTRKAMQWIVGTIIAIATAGIYLWDALIKVHK